MRLSQETVDAMAEEICMRLMVNGFDEQADRLVLTVDDDDGSCRQDLGGLCRQAVVDRVRKVLKSYV